MKNLKLLNRKYLSIILFFLFFGLTAQSEEPVDIWNIETKSTSEDNTAVEKPKEVNNSQNSIYEMQSQKENSLSIEQDQTLISKEIEIIGLYDPAKNGFDINMWSNSDGDQILNILKRINKIKLSEDASEILNIILLTNAYYPKKNISEEQFLKVKSNWLIKNSDLRLIEDYLINNRVINKNPELTKYLVDDYLSRSQIEKACEIFSKSSENINDRYLSKFMIYCLINNNKKEEAQLLLDLKKELGFKDKLYENRLNYLMGFTKKVEKSISEETILDFHLSHRTNPDFKFEPKVNTSKKIWKYLSTSNLLDNIQDVELTDLDKISIIEKATHTQNYTEKELFEFYKRFQFNINQLLNIKESTKTLPTIEARALIYQGILITTEIDRKLELMNALKNSFKNEKIENAFNVELRVLLSDIEKEEVPSNYSTFYEKYIDQDEIIQTNIKINNKILHQSKN